MHRRCSKAYYVASWSRCRRQDAYVTSHIWHLCGEKHKQNTCDVQIRFNACGSEPVESIKSHHFMNFSWLRYQISNDHCIIKTINCVFDHHSIISSSNVFKIEFLWRYDIKLAMKLSANVSNTISSSPLSSKKETFLEYQNVLFLLIFQQTCMHNERL